MEKTVGEIVRGVPRGKVFDSHYVIDTLIKDHSDVYLTFAAQRSGPVTTENFHSQIATVIRDLGPTVVKKLDFDSWSHNIHGKPNECRLWQRV